MDNHYDEEEPPSSTTDTTTTTPLLSTNPLDDPDDPHHHHYQQQQQQPLPRQSPSWRIRALSALVVLALLCLSSFVPLSDEENIWSSWPFVGKDGNSASGANTAVVGGVLFPGICLHRFHAADHLGVRGPYIVDDNNQDLETKADVENMVKEGDIKLGKLVHVSVVGRGGARNLVENDVRGLERLERWIRSRDWRGKDGKGLEWLVGWRNEWKVAEAGRLSGRGVKVVEGLGRRLGKVYEELGRKGVLLLSGQGKWMRESAKAFARGWGKDRVKVRVLTEGEDDVVMFVRNCEAFRRFKEKNVGKSSKRVELIERELMNVGNVTARILKVDQDQLDGQLVKSVYDACTLQVAQKLIDSQFCQLLSPKYLLLREKMDEEKSSLLRAQERLPTLSAPLARDVISSMDACLANTTSCAPVIVRLGDTETLVPFLSLLNVYKTEKKVRMTQLDSTLRMRRVNRVGQGEGASTCRSRLSTMAPFAGNLVMELYAPAEDDDKSEPVVRFRLHEQYIQRITACGGKSFCTLAQLKFYLEPVLTADWAHECTGHLENR